MEQANGNAHVHGRTATGGALKEGWESGHREALGGDWVEWTLGFRLFS